MCHQLCYDEKDCLFINYFGPNSFPFRSLCQLLASCEATNPCTDCAWETRDCFKTCGAKFSGVIEDNLLEYLQNVASEDQCHKHCVNNQMCAFYTYFLEEDAFSQTCILLSALIEPFQPCDTCLTGPSACQLYNKCSFLYNGSRNQSALMFTDPGVNVTILTFAECKLRFLAVGGGGYADSDGAGSGYVQYQSMDISGGSVIQMRVGNERQSSIVSCNGEVFEALPGYRGLNGYGGAGYSGGGAYYSGDILNFTRGNFGGSDGADGEGVGPGEGGDGQGLDITSFSFEYFWLKPGAGGKPFRTSGGHFYGGGGGGVLVNGTGPDWDSDNQGEGFGGGGGRHPSKYAQYTSDNVYGLPGVVLLEVCDQDNC